MKFKNWISPDLLENLVDLLNEHLKETRKKDEDIGEYINYAEDWRRTFLYEIDWAFYEVNECVILSKRYGFIKWLIEKDKIDKDKIDICLYDRNWTPYWWADICSYSLYESLLMLLSIQDSPIVFLIDVLK